MGLKDKLEIGLKPDAPYRPDNLPESQQDDPDCQEGAEKGSGSRQEAARERCTTPEPARVGGPHAEPEPDEKDQD